MFLKHYNPNNLSIDQIEKKVKRVKALLINEYNQILMCNIDDVFFFIGGHVEENERIIECLKREVLEESGIDLEIEKIEPPFLKIEYFNSNHYGTGQKCLSEIFYYVIYTNQEFDLNKVKLDDKESSRVFKLTYINLDCFSEILRKDMNYTSHFRLYEEMIEVIELYKKEFNGNKIKLYRK